MKKLYIFLLLGIFIFEVKAQNSNNTGGGNWNDPASWSGNAIPASSGNVVILSGDIITISSNQSCKSITINTGGTLKIISGANLTTSANITTKGTLNMEGGILNAGGSKTKYFYIIGGTLNFSGGTINISGRYSQKSGGNAYLSGDALLNIATLPGQNNRTIKIFSITSNGTFSVAAGSSAKVILKNGNLGDAPEIYYSPGTSAFDGGSLVIENGSGISDISMDSDCSMNKITVKAGTGNYFHFNDQTVTTLKDFSIISGKVIADAGARVTFENSPMLGGDGNLIAKTDSLAASLLFRISPVEKITFEITLKQGKYHYLSAPVLPSGNFNQLNLGLTGGVGNDNFFRWDESYFYNGITGNWIDILNGNDGTGTNSLMGSEGFYLGKGYSIRYKSATHTLQLTGNVSVSDNTVPVSKTTGSTAEGWNLIGNPFTSSLAANSHVSSDNFLSANSTLLDPVYGGIYLWDEQPGFHGHRDDHISISQASSAKYIATGQAFMVKANASGNIVFPAVIRNTGRTSVLYKSSESQWIRYHLNIKNDTGNYRTTLIAFNNNMTNGLDPTFDLGMLKVTSDLNLFTKLLSDNGYDYVIQALPIPEKEISIPIGLESNKKNNFTFSISQDSVNTGLSVILEDKLKGIRTDLLKQNYSFIMEKGRNTNRFILHFTPITTETQNETITNKNLPLKINVFKNTLHIKNLLEESFSGNISLYDLSGRMLKNYPLNLIPEGKANITIHNIKGVLIIRIKGNKFENTQKIYLQ